jgi:hypothetical protein
LEDFHFAAEVFVCAAAGGGGWDHHFDGDDAAGGEFATAEDFAHAAAADAAFDEEAWGRGGEFASEFAAGLAVPIDVFFAWVCGDGEVVGCFLAADAASDSWDFDPGFFDVDLEGAFSGFDDIAVFELGFAGAEAVEFCAVCASDVFEEADGGVEFDEEVIT